MTGRGVLNRKVNIMAGYSTSSPPKCILPSFNGSTPSVWYYESVDASTVVDASGYITNAADLGMKAKDIVFVCDNDSATLLTSTHIVSAINANGSADLSDLGATVGSTNSD
jgi:hypothetical protein